PALSFRIEAPPRAGLLFFAACRATAFALECGETSRRSARVKLTAPPDLPAALNARFDLVADLGELDPGWSEEVAATAARVVTISDFLLGVLRRFPRELAARVADRAALTRERLASLLDLANRTETDAMAELRRVRQIELARIAWRDFAG